MNIDITETKTTNGLDGLKAEHIVAFNNLNCKISLPALHISEPILQAILFEVCTYPKPGLVTPVSTGSHRDMSINTFIMSSAAVYPCFSLCAQLGLEHTGNPKTLLNHIRPIGIEYENRLLAVTNGINTQRGILFLASILATTVGYLKGQDKVLTIDNMGQTAAKICNKLCEDDFSPLKYRGPRTAGEYFYLTYGIKGIRGEAESGFSTVINIGLPTLLDAFDRGLSLRKSFIHCLIAIIASCEDTTVLSRSNMDVLNQLRQKAAEIMSLGGMFDHKGKVHVEDLDKWCCERNISPGGSADLLSLTISMYLFSHQHFPKGIC